MEQLFPLYLEEDLRLVVTGNNMKCNECKIRKKHWAQLKGDGWCEVHKGKFFFDERGKPCPICAKEQNLCERCGKKLENK